MKKLLLLTLLIFSAAALARGQQPPTQTIRGTVRDEVSAAPLAYATVVLEDMPGRGATSDAEGRFAIGDVPVGRHTVEVSMMGYETVTLREILVTSGKELYIDAALKERVVAVDGVVVRARVNKEEALNATATTGARMLSMEEAGRYAGGGEDPARMVAAFPGISAGFSSNSISIHGNSPDLLQWRLEGVEIPNPNHYADISAFGGGVFSSLSAHVLGNSDFFSGAFPAEYGNAVSAVFDMRMRTGNTHDREHTLQVGMLGIDAASEGPFKRGGSASYLFNYRYSTMGLIDKIDPTIDFGGSFDYQDLNFKFNFPTRRAGTFSLWGTGLVDKFVYKMTDPEEWVHHGDNQIYESDQYMGAAGLGHSIRIGTQGHLKTTLAVTTSYLDGFQDSFDPNLVRSPYFDMFRRNTDVVLTSTYNHKFGARHSNRTGFTYTRMIYDMNLALAPVEAQPLETISRGNGQTDRIDMFTNSTVRLTDRLTANVGVNSQALTLNDSWTVEPRIGFKHTLGRRTTLALAWGLNSRMERMDLYYVRTGGGTGPVNTDLGFTMAHHFMLTWAYKLGEQTIVKVEPFYQHLFDVPVEPGTSYSAINRLEFYAERELVNRGLGRNWGVDATLEQYLVDGFYYLFTGSLFDSRYRGGDGVWRDTRYNRSYIVNALAGKEWTVGRDRRKTFNLNAKLTLQGGERHTPVDVAATVADPDHEIQYDETRAFSLQYDPMLLANLTVSYRINRSRSSHEFGFFIVNLTEAPERYGFHYNLNTGTIEENKSRVSFKNIFYRIHF